MAAKGPLPIQTLAVQPTAEATSQGIRHRQLLTVR
jgi:hypothetical protein